MYDSLLLGGWVVDGTGNPARRADVAIQGDRIAAVGCLRTAQAKRVFDVTGKLICPGFIDAHSHTDVTVEANAYFESTIRQGITTEVVGNCGDSTAPVPPGGGGGFGRIGGGAAAQKRSLAEHMRFLESRGMSANLAWLVGHNTLRSIAGIKGPDYTPEQYQVMERELRKALDDGALGMSSGLEFEPGRACRPEELYQLTGVLKEYDAIYTSHIRNRDAGVLEALEEFLHCIRLNGIRGEVSHMNIRHRTHAPDHAFDRCIAMIQQARDDGFDVLTDMTPLNYGIGQMAGILPQWLTGMPPEQLGPALRDPQVRARLRSDCDRYWRFIAAGEWDRVRMQNNRAFPEINGMTFPEISRLWNKDPWDCYFDILAAVAPDLDSVVLVSYLFTDEHLKETISHPLYMLVVDGYSTDIEGPAGQATGFPLHYIGMAWFLTHHVRELHTLRLEEAVRKMTSMPAQHFGFSGRGLVHEGYFADLCVFAYDKLETPFDLDRPRQYTRGMDYVFVNGCLVLDGGVHLHTQPGRHLRRGQ